MKTPDEIKKGLECAVTKRCNWKDFPYCKPDDEFCGCITENRIDTLAYIQQLEAAQPKWISVEERLPEPGNKILIAFPHSILGFTLHVGEYTGKVWWMESAIIDTPPYWMPLPEPPKEG